MQRLRAAFDGWVLEPPYRRPWLPWQLHFGLSALYLFVTLTVLVFILVLEPEDSVLGTIVGFVLAAVPAQSARRAYVAKHSQAGPATAEQVPEPVMSVGKAPDFSTHTPDPELVRHHGRVAELRREGVVVGHLLVRRQAQAQSLGGRGTNTRWGRPQDALQIYTCVDGQHYNSWWEEPGAAEKLKEVVSGRFAYHAGVAEILDARWLDEAEAARVRTEIFRFKHWQD